jgi:hypothetical protein
VPSLQPVEVTFFEDAPVVVSRRARVDAPRDRVFTLLATDPAGWGRWFPGFSHDGRWETPPPHGVGSVRTVRAFGVRYRETILAWDEGERFAFRIDQSSVPMAKAFAEDYRLVDDGSGTTLSWTIAMVPGPALRLGKPLLPMGFGLMLRRAAAGLSKVA